MFPLRRFPMMSSLRAHPFWALSTVSAAVFLVACNDPASSTAAGSIRRVSGDSQTVAAGALLPASMVVRVLAQNGDPLSGQVVSWTLASGATGTLAASTSTTDGSGQASMDYTAGKIAGSVAVGATVASTISVVFSHTIVAAATSMHEK